MIHGHGDDAYLYGGTIRYNFSSNVFTGFDLGPLTRHLYEASVCISSYPEPEPLEAEAVVADHISVPHASVMVTNGATEAIYIIAHMLDRKRSAFVIPTFSEYEDACRLYNHAVSFADSLDALPSGVDAVWLCNPNNPTGGVYPKHVLLDYINAHSASLFIIDQSYADYTALPVISSTEAVELPNVLLLGSLTKRFAIPGLRVGYAVGNEDIISRMRALRMPWSVNQYAIEAVKYLMARQDDFVIDTSMLHGEAVCMADALSSLGIDTQPTDCNFILCRLPRGTASEIKAYLAMHHGILIRDASNFRGLTPQHFRIAAQRPEINDLLIKAISQWMSF